MLPLMEQLIGPGVTESLARTAEPAAEPTPTRSTTWPQTAAAG